MHIYLFVQIKRLNVCGINERGFLLSSEKKNDYVCVRRTNATAREWKRKIGFDRTKSAAVKEESVDDRQSLDFRRRSRGTDNYFHRARNAVAGVVRRHGGQTSTTPRVKWTERFTWSSSSRYVTTTASVRSQDFSNIFSKTRTAGLLSGRRFNVDLCPSRVRYSRLHLEFRENNVFVIPKRTRAR